MSGITIQAAADQILWDHATGQPVAKLPPGSPAELVEFVKEFREEVLEKSKDRYFRTPPTGYKLVPGPSMNPFQENRIVSYVNAQILYDMDMVKWFGHAIEELQKEGVARADVRAACGLINWQFMHKPRPVYFVLDEIIEDLERTAETK
jgi:hypothetical protein